jgi:hypothetical protein
MRILPLCLWFLSGCLLSQPAGPPPGVTASATATALQPVSSTPPPEPTDPGPRCPEPLASGALPPLASGWAAVEPPSDWPNECPREWEQDARLHIHPGAGLGSIRIGVSTAHDVLALFGHNAEVLMLGNGTVLLIDYDRKRPPEEEAAWRGPRSVRPQKVKFNKGLVESLHFGPYQRCLQTAQGMKRIHFLKDMENIYGKGYRLTRGYLNHYRYEALGLEVTVDPQSYELISFEIFAPKGR